jgi:hypothetical protein
MPSRLVITLVWLIFPTLAACSAPPAPATAGAEFLYVWTGDEDGADPDFLAVFDVRPGSARYGELIRTVPVEGRANWPHHTEYELATGRTLFANGWNTGRTFVFDLSRPDAPRVVHSFTAVGGYAYPHSYARLPNGNVLATFQSLAGDYTPPGGLVELDESGALVRAVSGASPEIAAEDTWPYSLLVLPDLDRVVTTNTRMGTVAEWFAGEDAVADAHAHAVGRDTRPTHVQVWRLSSLELLATLRLPAQAGGHHEHPAEPRRLANGEVLVNTFTCGLYRIVGLETEHAAIEPVLHAPFESPKWCAVPVVLGNYWIQPSATEDAIVAYDLSDPAGPRGGAPGSGAAPFLAPHWLALDPSGNRIVVTADDPAFWVMLLHVDPATGRLSVDERFRDAGSDRPGVSFDRTHWPHGATGRAMPHGAVFSARRGSFD